jgi:hypothetical protein
VKALNKSETMMERVSERFLTNKKGRRISVVLNMKEYKKILEELEELESIRAYDAAKKEKSEMIPLERALGEIERSRK